MDQITVLISDVHAVLRERISRFLRQQKDIQVVGEATDWRQVLSQVEALRPHILILDLGMPKMGGLEALPQIRVKSPTTKILVRAEFFEEDFVARGLQDGIHGCVLKSAPPPELLKAIRTTHAGEFWVQRRLVTRVVESLRFKVEELQGSAWQLGDVLSKREQEVVIWAMQGMTNKEIGGQLGISAKTVKTHLQHVFRKLNVRRRVQLSALSPHLAPSISHPTRQSPPSA
ncbi:MAG TPA: response regulator transcription factor [Candidatus Tectomicrobia bacterium]|nr:response regulator transcription factor [Candidatus Tectomicrobia bacterium]